MVSHGLFRLFAGFYFKISVSGMRPEKIAQDVVGDIGTPCGLGKLDLIVDDATFGDGKRNFVSECRSMFPSSQCHGAAEEIWEGRDLAAKYITNYDSDFCVKFREVAAAHVSTAFLQTGSDLDASFIFKWKDKKKDTDQGKKADEKDDSGDQKDEDESGHQKDEDQGKEIDEKDESGDQKDTGVAAKSTETQLKAKSIETQRKEAQDEQSLESRSVWENGLAESWVPGCYSGDTFEHTLKLGIAVDHQLQAGWTIDKVFKQAELEKEIKRTVEAASFTTQRQFGIKLEWKVKYLHESQMAGNDCPTDATTQKERTSEFQSFMREAEVGVGAWFMLSGCKYYYGAMAADLCPFAKYYSSYQVFCVDGNPLKHWEYGNSIGSVGTSLPAATIMLFPDLTLPNSVRSMQSVTHGVPIIFLQELAEGLGADYHLGGTNAGVMATAKEIKRRQPTLNEFWALGAFQFNTRFRKGEMCNFLERTVKTQGSALTKSQTQVLKPSRTPSVLAKLVDCDGTSTVFRDPSLHAGLAVCCDADGAATFVQHDLVVDNKIVDDHLSWESAHAVCQKDGKHMCGGQEEDKVRTACANKNALGVRVNFAWMDAKGSWHLAPLGDDTCKNGEKITDKHSCKWAAEIALAAHHLESNGQWSPGGWNHLPSGCSVKESSGKIHFNSYRVKPNKAVNPKNDGNHRLVCSGSPEQ